MRWRNPVVLLILLVTPQLSGCGSAVPEVEPTEQVDKETDDLHELIVGQLMRKDKQACIEPLQKVLLDEDGQVRGAVLEAIQEAIAQENCTAGFREAAFEVLVPMVDRENDTIFDDVPTCLLAIDTDKASSLLLSDRYFHKESPNLHEILEALYRRRVPVPANRLVALLEALRSESNEYPKSYAYGYGLLNLARTNSSVARLMIQEAMQRQDTAENAEDGQLSAASTVRDLAADAWCELHGIEEPFTAVSRRVADWSDLDRSLEKLSAPQRLVFYVGTMRNDVKNGGFSQYFRNSCGCYAGEAVAGLETIQDTHSANVLKQAIRLFGEDGPARDRLRRIDQLTALPPAESAKFDALDSEFYRDQDHLYVKIAIYAAENAEHFRPVEDQVEGN